MYCTNTTVTVTYVVFNLFVHASVGQKVVLRACVCTLYDCTADTYYVLHMYVPVLVRLPNTLISSACGVRGASPC